VRARLRELSAQVFVTSPLPQSPIFGIIENMKATIETSKGTITLELDAERAPATVANFAEYAKNGFYDGTIFHRVIDGFMIQGGGFTRDMNQKTTRDPIAIESMNGLRNLRGTIAMARTMDPNSATSQFFINLVDNAFLDFTAPTTRGYGYAVFGRVLDGIEVVDAIAKVRTGSVGPYENVPSEAVVIKKITMV
jgi:cyclophilin family peptidyl-prolyl cis-trans isomerase